MNPSHKNQAPAKDGESKQPPPLEVSMKYAAWDIKAIPPAIKELVNEVRLLRMALGGKMGRTPEESLEITF